MSRVAVKCHQASNSTVTSSANQSTAAASALTASRRLTYIILSQLSLDLYTLIPTAKVCVSKNFLATLDVNIQYVR